MISLEIKKREKSKELDEDEKQSKFKQNMQIFNLLIRRSNEERIRYVGEKRKSKKEECELFLHNMPWGVD